LRFLRRLLQRLKYEVVRFLSNVQVQRSDEAAMRSNSSDGEAAAKQRMAFEHAEAGSAVAEPADAPAAPIGTAADDTHTAEGRAK